MKYTKVKNEKLYKLNVNNEKDIIAFDIKQISKRTDYIVDCWVKNNKYGTGYWANKPAPIFEIITESV